MFILALAPLLNQCKSPNPQRAGVKDAGDAAALMARPGTLVLSGSST